MAEVLLEAIALAHQFPTRTLWRDLSFAIAAGDRVALVGPSGSGKTVLLRTLAVLEPLQQGEIQFRGRPLGHWDIPRYRTQVMYLPQRPALREGTVKEVIRAPWRLAVHRHKSFHEESVLKLLAGFDRDCSFLEKPTLDLSGGEGQIVAFIRALLLQPTLLLLDEPTASMDSRAAASLETHIDRWMADNSNRACVWTSHNRQQLDRICTRYIQLQIPSS